MKDIEAIAQILNLGITLTNSKGGTLSLWTYSVMSQYKYNWIDEYDIPKRYLENQRDQAITDFLKEHNKKR
jgi:hypothetical protein